MGDRTRVQIEFPHFFIDLTTKDEELTVGPTDHRHDGMVETTHGPGSTLQILGGTRNSNQLEPVLISAIRRA
jgi:hypothetical protein